MKKAPFKFEEDYQLQSILKGKKEDANNARSIATAAVTEQNRLYYQHQ